MKPEFRNPNPESMTEIRMPNSVDTAKRPFDLEERTGRFGEAAIAFAKSIAHNPMTIPLITQLVRAATSIGANYCEADDAESNKDFRHKIGICRKEAKETKHWLLMIRTEIGFGRCGKRRRS